MKLVLAEPKYLKESISIISDLVTEARFKINKDGMELVAMDPANVAMVIFKLLSSAFAEYEVKEPVNLAINLNNLKQVLRRVKPADNVGLELEENKLKVQIKGTSVRTFHLPIIDIDEREQKVPDLKFPLTITTSCTTLNDAIEDAEIVAESLSFTAEPNRFTVSAEGDLSKANIEVSKDNTTKIKLEGGKIRSKYSIEYLKKMMQGSKLADEVTIHFNKDYPLKLEYKVLNKVLLAFILAPRVDND